MTKVVISFKQKIQLHELMKTHLVKKPDGFYKYINNITNDTDMAEKAENVLGIKLTPPIIRGIRMEMFGQVKMTPSPKGQGNSLESRVTAIEEYLTSKNPQWRDAN